MTTKLETATFLSYAGFFGKTDAYFICPVCGGTNKHSPVNPIQQPLVFEGKRLCCHQSRIVDGVVKEYPIHEYLISHTS